MRESKNRVEELAAGYWSGALTECEEQELRQALAQRSDLSEELAALKVMMEGFEALAAEYEPITTPTRRRKPRLVEMLTTLSAAAAILVVGLIVELKSTPEPEIYCYINGEPITDIEVAMEQTKYLEPLAALSETISALETIMLN